MVLEITFSVHPRCEALDWHSCSSRWWTQSSFSLVACGVTGGAEGGGGDGGGGDGGGGDGGGGDGGGLGGLGGSIAQMQCRSGLPSHDAVELKFVL